MLRVVSFVAVAVTPSWARSLPESPSVLVPPETETATRNTLPSGSAQLGSVNSSSRYSPAAPSSIVSFVDEPELLTFVITGAGWLPFPLEVSAIPTFAVLP